MCRCTSSARHFPGLQHLAGFLPALVAAAVVANAVRFLSAMRLALAQLALWNTPLRLDATNAPLPAGAAGAVGVVGDLPLTTAMGAAASAVCMALRGQGRA